MSYRDYVRLCMVSCVLSDFTDALNSRGENPNHFSKDNLLYFVSVTWFQDLHCIHVV